MPETTELTIAGCLDKKLNRVPCFNAATGEPMLVTPVDAREMLHGPLGAVDWTPAISLSDPKAAKAAAPAPTPKKPTARPEASK